MKSPCGAPYRSIRSERRRGRVRRAQPSEWERLAASSGGSVRRVLSLHAAKGLALHERISKILDSLPQVDWGAVHALGDELSGQAADQRYQLFFELSDGRHCPARQRRGARRGNRPRLPGPAA